MNGGVVDFSSGEPMVSLDWVPPQCALQAYGRWGEASPSYLPGEFAFAIWDGTRERLFAARDAGGTRPFFYSLLPGGAVRFAANAAQLLAAGVAPVLDEAGLVDFLLSRGALLPTRTPLRAVQRLGPAHSLIFDRTGLRVSSYWSVYDDGPRFASDTEAGEACSLALQDAIRDRVANTRRAAISLSGGWDSSALFVLWQWMRRTDPALAEPWHYTYFSDSPESDERAEVRRLLLSWPAPGDFARLHAEGVLEGLDLHCARLGMPEPASGWRWMADCAGAARAAGASYIVAGEAGNEVFQSSVFRPADLFFAGRPRAAFRQLQSWGRDSEAPVRSFVWPFVLRPILAARYPTAVRFAKSFRRGQSLALSYLTDRAQEIARDLISQSVERNRLRLDGRTLSSWDKRTALERWCSELYPLPAAPESEGVEWTAPFLDRRVISAGLAALDCESGTGSTRRLLASIVSAATGQPFHGRHAHYTGILETALRRALDAGDDRFRAPRLAELGIVEPVRLRAAVDRFRAGSGAGLTALWRLLSAETWARMVIQ